ncbi:MAG: hypothetical protein IJR55_00775 [Clostridia bacterium]|nr:hypothetical protein [Clostridia bacterium]
MTAELKVKEHDFYRSIYCGLCRSMKKHTGGVSVFTLSYDMVFFALVRLALGDTAIKIRRRACEAHPFKKRPMADDCPELEYSARVNAILVYYKCLDDVADEKGAKRLFYRAAVPYAKRMKKRAALSEGEATVKKQMEELAKLEEERCSSPDALADAFGKLLASLAAYGLEETKRLLAYQLCFHVGRFVYLADAADDYREDVKLGRYNPFACAFSNGEEVEKFFSESLSDILNLELYEAEKALALIERDGREMIINCLDNIIHGGMESRIYSITRVGKGEKDEKRSV